MRQIPCASVSSRSEVKIYLQALPGPRMRSSKPSLRIFSLHQRMRGSMSSGMSEPDNTLEVQAFYDELAPLYHLVYENWEASVARQGTALASLIGEHWGAGARTVLDAAVGIGTQALGLLALGFRVTGSDLSYAAVTRAQREAAARHLALPCPAAALRAMPRAGAS